MAYSQTQHRFFDLLMSSQYWTADEMRIYQRYQLAQLLQHARRTVPFYANRLDVLFTEGGDIDWDRWSELPLVTRDDLIHRRAEMQSGDLPKSHGSTAEFSTSGSTGAPVTTTHNASATLASRAAAYRFYAWHELDYSRAMGEWSGDDPTIARPPDGDAGGPWSPPWLPNQAQRYHMNRMATAAEVLEFAHRRELAYLWAGATDVRLLGYEALRLGVSVKFQSVLTRGAVLTEHTERLMLDVFGAKAIPTYSSKEGYRMAHRCPSTRNYHVTSEIVFLEVLHSDGGLCTPGETGQVVITPLLSAAQPLIRYNTGDLATVGEPCPCGRHLPVLTDIVGRVKHVFRLSDGRSVLPRLSVEALMSLNASSFQVAQIAVGEIEVRYVPHGETNNERPVADELRNQTGGLARVAFRQVPRFEHHPAQKHIEYVSEVPGQSQ